MTTTPLTPEQPEPQGGAHGPANTAETAPLTPPSQSPRPSAPAQAQVPPPAPEQGPHGLSTGGPRSGPIVWGALILVFCAYVAQLTLGGGVDTTAWLIGTVIGLGVLLLVVGGAVLFRNRGR